MRLYLILALLIIVPRHVLSQPAVCDPKLLTSGAKESLSYQLRGERCEGVYTAEVAGESLELVSLLQGKFQFDLQPDVVLEVSAAKAVQGPVYVRAVALPPKTYYRMDSQISSDRAMLWPIKEVLVPTGLNSKDIGIFGWIGPENKKTFVPLKVTQRNISPQTQAGQEQTVFLTVRPSVDVESIYWRWSQVKDQECHFGKWQNLSETPVNAGRRVPIALPGQEGELCVEVKAKAKDIDLWLPLNIRLLM